MDFLALSSIIALLIKCSLFWVGKSALFKDNRPLAIFLIALCGLNAAELMLFINDGNQLVQLGIMKLYYVAAAFSAAALLYLSLHIIQYASRYTMIIIAVSLSIAVATLTPGVMISGVESIGYSVTRVPGKYFLLFQIFLISSLLLSFGILFQGAVKSTQRMINKRSLILLISVAPLIFFTITITVTLSLGIKINGTVIISLMTSLMLIILVYSEKQYRLFKFLSYVPYTHEHELRTRAGKLINQMIDDMYDGRTEVDFKHIRAELETILIEIAVEFTGGNKTRAAKILGIGKATLHRKIEGLGI